MTAAAATRTDTPRSFREVWLISLGHGLTHWYTATFYILLPLIGKELGLSYTEIGVIMTAQHLAGAISNVPGGILVDTVGRKGYLMAASLFWVGFPYALMSLTQNYWMLLVFVVLVGIGSNIWHPAAIPTLAHRYPERKGLVLSFHGMGGNLGEAIAPFVIGALLTWFSWRAVVVINVVPGITMAVMILVFLGALKMATRAEPQDSINAGAGSWELTHYLRDFASLFRNRDLLLISFSSGFRTMTQAGLLTFLPVYLAYEMNYSPAVVGLCMTLLQAAGFIAAPIGGHLSDTMGRKKVLMSSMLLSAVVIIGMAFAGRSAVFIMFIALAGFFLYAGRPVMQAWTIDSTPKNLAGTSIGLLFGIQQLGAAISPAIFGMIADAFDIFTAFFFLAGTIVFANLLIFFMPNGGEKHAKSAAVA